MTRVLPLLGSLFLAFSIFGSTADLAVTIQAPEFIEPNAPVTFSATVENRGPDPAVDVHFWLTISVNAGCFDGESIGTLQPGEKRSYSCTRSIPLNLYIVQPYTAAESTTPDADETNNSARALVKLHTSPDLFIFTNAQPLVAPKIPFQLDLLYGNLAQTTATNVVITVKVPTRFISVPATCTVDGGTARCHPADVDPPPYDFSTYAPIPIGFVVEAPDESATSFPIEMSIESSEADYAPVNNHFTREGRTYRTFFVTNTDDANGGSLRAAIDDANAQCGAGWPCLIAFRIPADREGKQIAPVTPLPHINADSLLIDGVTEALYFNSSVIHLEGSLQTGSAFEFDRLCSGGVRGLSIHGFPGAAIVLHPQSGCGSSTGRTFQANVIEKNGRGIELSATASILDNTIQDHTRSGLFLAAGQANVDRNVIRNNGASGVFVGTDASGTDLSENTIVGNREFGIAIAPDAKNVSAHKNSISGNGLLGIDWGLDGAANGPVGIPTITRVYPIEIGAWAIEGTVPAGGNVGRDVEIFASPSADPSGNGEGAHYLGTVRGLSAGNTFTFTLLNDLPGSYITATATYATYNGWLRTPPVHSDGDTGWGYTTTTSEFSRAFAVPR